MSNNNWNNSAENYYDDVISPLKNSLSNPLFDDLQSFNGKIVELGCGIGEIIPFLSKNFDEVHAWDYSEKMIEKAMKKNAELKNVFFEVKNIIDLNEKNIFDVVIAVNSLLEPNQIKLNKMIENTFELLKENGTLICILPSIESYIYQEMIANEKKALGLKIPRKEFFKKNKIDFFNGTINFEGEKQKAFYRFEILHRFEKTGFKEIEVSKVRYKWKDWFQAGQRYFPSEKEPWDWYVKCKK